jgi:hypothetical protein
MHESPAILSIAAFITAAFMRVTEVTAIKTSLNGLKDEKHGSILRIPKNTTNRTTKGDRQIWRMRLNFATYSTR